MTEADTASSPSSSAKSTPAQQFRLVPKVINGGVAGIVGVTCVFPIDLVKTRLQNQVVAPDGSKQYSGIWDCFKKSYRAGGGIRGMYSGSGVNILLITPEKAIKLTANDTFRYYLSTGGGTGGGHHLPLWREMIAGGGAGLCQIVVTTPMELLKIQLQQGGKASGSATTIALDLIKTRGIAGLYKGTGATALRDVTFSTVYFPLFAHLNKFGPRKSSGSSEAAFWVSLVAGNVAGAFSCLVVTPMDVIKTRLQMITPANQSAQYSGVLDAVSTILRTEGIPAFFKGAVARMIVVAPLFGIAQMVYYLGVAEFVMGIDRKSAVNV